MATRIVKRLHELFRRLPCALGIRALVAIVLAYAPIVAMGQSQVSGAIAVDTHWTAANSPYVVSGNLVVQGGATLEVDAGVIIYMAPAASVTVQAGTIRAMGAVSAPIHILSDKVRQGLAPAPGDFQAWTFNPGATDVLWEHVTLQHGSGIAINGTSPVLNYVDLRDNAGPAIRVDLAASPRGVGNQASGNGLNGVAVPAGDITGTVNWGLKGIPYVIQSGTLSVGASPVVTSIAPDTIQQGETTTVVVNGTRLSGLAGATFDKDGLTAEVLPGGTATQASLNVAANEDVELGDAALTLLVDAGETASAPVLTVAQAQPTIVSLAPDRVYVGQGLVRIAVEGRGFNAQSVAQLGSTNLTTEFVDTTHLVASVPGQSTAANLRFRLRSPDPLSEGQFLYSNEVILPILPAQITVAPTPAEVIRGSTRAFTVTLPYPASGGDATVTLVSSIPSVANVPASVIIAEGASSAQFELSALANGTTVVTASRNGLISGQATVTVVPPPTLGLNPNVLVLGAGRSATLNVTSSKTAGEGGLHVQLSSSDPAKVVVPDEVVIPSGTTSASFAVETQAVGEVTVTATAPDYLAVSANVNVRPVSINLPSGTVVAPGLSRSVPVTLSDPAPAGGLVVALESVNPAIATASESISIAEGQTEGNFQLTGVTAGVTSIRASATGYETGELPVTVESIAIEIGSPAVSSISIPAELTWTYPLRLSRAAPAGGVVVSLTTDDPSIASVAPSSITIAAGETSGGSVNVRFSGHLPGQTTLVASSPGLSTANVPVTVRNKATLGFSRSSMVVGKGLSSYLYDVMITRMVDGATFNGAEALTVNLSSSDASKVSVPATVTIPANQYYAYFTVTGVDFTSGTPVTIDATAQGYSAPTTKLAVTTVAPQFQFTSLDTKRSPASARDDFYLQTYVPGANYSTNQTAATDLPIDLSIVEASTPGIVPGFHSALTGGVVTTQATLPAGRSYSNTVYVDTPTVAGSYKVQASAAGIATSASSLVTISAPTLGFSRSSMVVGKGLSSYLYDVMITRMVDGATFNGAEALTVNLSSSDASKVSVPATVTIPANQYYAYFTVTGVDFTSGTPVTIDATAQGYSAPTTKLAVTTVAPQFQFTSLDTKRSPASARDDFYLQTYVPGANYSTNQTAATDLPIDLSIVEASTPGIVPGFHSAQTAGTATTQVTLPADRSYSNTVYVDTPTVAGSYKVQASAAGIATSASSLVTVSAPTLGFSRSTVVVGKGLRNYEYEVTVRRMVDGATFNGAEALTVNLQCSSTAICTVPATVTIPANSYYVYFRVAGIGMGTTTVSASAVGYQSGTDLNVSVINPSLVLSGLSTSLKVGATNSFSVYLNVPGADYSSNQTAVDAIPINLTSSAPGVATTSSAVTVAAGSTFSGNATLTGVAAGTTTVTASGTDLNSVTSSTITVSP